MATVEADDERLDPFRETGDTREFLPLHVIDPAPWNPKKKIHGVYRNGLAASLHTFAISDDLKVWPNPRSPGRYYALDGNQRVDVLAEIAIRKYTDAEISRREIALGVPEAEALAAQKQADEDAWQAEREAIVAAGGEPPRRARREEGDIDLAEAKRRLRALRERAVEEYEADESAKSAVRTLAMNERVECRIVARLSREDAELFTASFDRNHAPYDETAVADIAERIESSQRHSKKVIDALLRPDRPFIAPTLMPPTSPARIEAEKAKASYDAAVDAAAANVSEDKPWGDPPPPPPENIGLHAPASPPPAMVPMMFSFSPENYRRFTDGILRSKARVIREKAVLEAVEHLARLDESEPSDSAIVEIALLVFERRHEIAKARQERTQGYNT